MEQRQIIRPGDSLPEVLGFTDFFGYLLYKCRFNPTTGEVLYEGFEPFGDEFSHPNASDRNFGLAFMEATKAYSTIDGRCVVFRPDRHLYRLGRAAHYYNIKFDTTCLMRPLIDLIAKNSHCIPPYQTRNPGRRYLYVRIEMYGSGTKPPPLQTGEQTALSSSGEMTITIFVSPSENYFRGSIKAIAAPMQDRAKAWLKGAFNYAPSFKERGIARQLGFEEIIHLNKYTGHPEEAGPANLFLVLKDGTIYTPSTERKSILEGVTRDAILRMVGALGFSKVVEGNRTFEDLFPDIAEAFCCGTAVSVTPMTEIFFPNDPLWNLEQPDLTWRPYREYPGRTLVLSSAQPDSTTMRIRNALIQIQTGTEAQDPFEWNQRIY
jgi:branched-chain amino acid aminotransferase